MSEVSPDLLRKKNEINALSEKIQIIRQLGFSITMEAKSETSPNIDEKRDEVARISGVIRGMISVGIVGGISELQERKCSLEGEILDWEVQSKREELGDLLRSVKQKSEEVYNAIGDASMRAKLLDSKNLDDCVTLRQSFEDVFKDIELPFADEETDEIVSRIRDDFRNSILYISYRMAIFQGNFEGLNLDSAEKILLENEVPVISVNQKHFEQPVKDDPSKEKVRVRKNQITEEPEDPELAKLFRLFFPYLKKRFSVQGVQWGGQIAFMKDLDKNIVLRISQSYKGGNNTALDFTPAKFMEKLRNGIFVFDDPQIGSALIDGYDALGEESESEGRVDQVEILVVTEDASQMGLNPVSESEDPLLRRIEDVLALLETEQFTYRASSNKTKRFLRLSRVASIDGSIKFFVQESGMDFGNYSLDEIKNYFSKGMFRPDQPKLWMDFCSLLGIQLPQVVGAPVLNEDQIKQIAMIESVMGILFQSSSQKAIRISSAKVNADGFVMLVVGPPGVNGAKLKLDDVVQSFKIGKYVLKDEEKEKWSNFFHFFDINPDKKLIPIEEELTGQNPKLEKVSNDVPLYINRKAENQYDRSSKFLKHFCDLVSRSLKEDDLLIDIASYKDEDLQLDIWPDEIKIDGFETVGDDIVLRIQYLQGQGDWKQLRIGFGTFLQNTMWQKENPAESVLKKFGMGQLLDKVSGEMIYKPSGSSPQVSSRFTLEKSEGHSDKMWLGLSETVDSSLPVLKKGKNLVPNVFIDNLFSGSLKHPQQEATLDLQLNFDCSKLIQNCNKLLDSLRPTPIPVPKEQYLTRSAPPPRVLDLISKARVGLAKNDPEWVDQVRKFDGVVFYSFDKAQNRHRYMCFEEVSYKGETRIKYYTTNCENRLPDNADLAELVKKTPNVKISNLPTTFGGFAKMLVTKDSYKVFLENVDWLKKQDINPEVITQLKKIVNERATWVD